MFSTIFLVPGAFPALAILLALTVIAALKTTQLLKIFPMIALELAPNEQAAAIISIVGEELIRS